MSGIPFSYSSIGSSGYSGYSGTSGYSGYSGYSGIGTSGYSGYSGVSGSAAASGYSGYSGFSGNAATTVIVTYSNSFSAGQAIYRTSGGYALAQANAASATDIIGVVTAATGSQFTYVANGYTTGFTGLVDGAQYYLSDTTPGLVTTTVPTANGSIIKPVMIAIGTTAAQIVEYPGAQIGTGAIGGNGTSGYLAKFTAPSTEANSIIQDNGSLVTVNGNLTATGNVGATKVGAVAGTFTLDTTTGGFNIKGVNGTPPNLAYLANNYFPKFYTRADTPFGVTVFDQLSAVAIQAADLTNGVNAQPLLLNPYGGNVGIGTTSPSQKLEVNGNAQIDGNLYFSNTLPILGFNNINAQQQNTYYGVYPQVEFASNTTAANNQAFGGLYMARKTYVSTAGSGNDLTDKVGIFMRGFYEGTGSSLPLYFGGFGYSSETPAMTLDANGLLGIGGYPSGTSTASTSISSGALQVAGGVGVGGAGNFGGNLTVGTTPSSWSSFNAIDFGGAGGLASYNGATPGGTELVTNAYYNGSWTYKATAAASNFTADVGSFSWRIALSGTANTAITWTTPMTLTSAGNLGIGTTSPTTSLQINNNGTYATSGNMNTGTIVGNGSGGVALNSGAYDTNTIATSYAWFNSGYANNAGIGVPMVFATGGAERMRITSAGNVGIGALTPAFTLTVSGAIQASGNVGAYSDERVKKNWRDLGPDFVDQLAEIKSGVYDRVDVELTQVGVGAQSLQKILPEAVMSDPEGNLSVTYGNAALAICVELAKEIKALKAEIQLLKSSK